jgi:DNA modification methylase
MLQARVLVGDAVSRLAELPDGSVRTCVTSPPYWGLRDYGNDGQLGLETTPQEFVENLCKVFDEVWRVLADDGTLWVNLGDSYFSTQAGGGNAPSRKSTLTTNGGRGPQPGDKYEASRLMPSRRVFPDVRSKNLVGIPWRFAFAMQDRGWYLRQDIIWAKPNPMPESVTDRCTKSHEYIFLLTKNPRYYFDNEAIREPLAASSVSRLAQDVESQAGYSRANGGVKTNGNMKAVGPRFGGNKYGDSDDPKHATKSGNVYEPSGKRNKRSVWNVSTRSYKEAHFAVYPAELITPCILSGSAEGDTVLDPFSGSGTTGEVALTHGRNYVGVELNPEYAALSEKRITNAIGMLGEVRVD